MGYFGFMRSGEFTTCKANQGDPVSFADLAVDSHSSPSVVRILLRRAKTDPFSQGFYIHLGRTSARVCPVAALFGQLPGRQTAIARPPFFVWRDGSPLSQHHLVKEVRVILSAVGLDSSKYAGHSFRISAATSAARAGVPSHLIKMRNLKLTCCMSVPLGKNLPVFLPYCANLALCCTACTFSFCFLLSLHWPLYSIFIFLYEYVSGLHHY